MFVKKIDIFFILLLLLILSQERAFIRRHLEDSETNIFTFTTTPIMENEQGHHVFNVRFNGDNVKSIKNIVITKNSQETFNCEFIETPQSSEECYISSNEEGSVSLFFKIEAKTIYSITSIKYTDKDGEKSLTPKDPIAKFMINPISTETKIITELEDNVNIYFNIEHRLNAAVYQGFENLLKCEKDKLSCSLSLEKKAKEIKDIQILIDNIYYQIDPIEVLTYEISNSDLKQGITIYSISDLSQYKIEGKTKESNELTITFNPQSVESATENEETNTEKVQEKTFVLSNEPNNENGIYDTFVLKDNEDKISLSIPNSIGSITLNTISDAMIINESDNQSVLYLLFEEPILQKINPTIKVISDNSEDASFTECTQDDSNYSLVCTLNKIISNVISIQMDTKESYIIHNPTSDNFKVNVYTNTDNTILTKVNTNSIQIDNTKFIIFDLNKETTTLPALITFTPISPESRPIKISSNEQEEKIKLSLNGMKLYVNVEEIKEEGLYKMSYKELEDSEEILFKDIFLFYNNEIELETIAINLPVGEATINEIYIKLKNKININQIISVKCNNEFLKYNLNELNDNEIVVNVPKDFSVKEIKNYGFTITDFNIKKYTFNIEVKEAPSFIFSQTFFVEKQKGENVYNVDVTLKESNDFVCEINNFDEQWTTIKENERVPVNLSGEIEIKYRILGRYEYIILNKEIFKPNELFNEINNCFLQGITYDIEQQPKITDYYALYYSQDKFKMKIQKVDDDDDNVITEETDIKEPLTKGKYKINYYYYDQENPQFIYSKIIKVYDSGIPENFFIEEDNSVSFLKKDQCSDLKVKIKLESKEGQTETKTEAECNLSEGTYKCTTAEGSSLTEGQYKIYINEKTYNKDIDAYFPINEDNISIDPHEEFHSGVNLIQISSEKVNLKQITSITITEKSFVDSSSKQEIITYTSEGETNKFEFDKKENKITLSLNINPGNVYTLKTINVVEPGKSYSPDSSKTIVKLPLYEVTSKYIFFNSDNIQFEIKITRPSDSEDSLFLQQIDLVINNKVNEKACSLKENESGTTRQYVCIYDENIVSQNLEIKANKDDSSSLTIELIKYEIKSDDKCYDSSLIDKETNSKFILQTEDTSFKINVCDRYYSGKKNDDKKELEFQINIYDLKDKEYCPIIIEKNNESYPLDNEYIILVKNKMTFDSISPGYLSLSTSPQGPINIKMDNIPDTFQDKSNLKVQLIKEGMSSLDLICTIKGSNFECNLPENEVNAQNNNLEGDYNSLEITIDGCIHVFEIDFSIKEYNEIQANFIYDFSITQKPSGGDSSSEKYFKVTIQKEENQAKIFDINTISKLKFIDNEGKDKSYIKSDGETTEIDSTFSINNSIITVYLPFINGYEHYSISEIEAGEKEDVSFKRYKKAEKVIRDYVLLTEFMAFEKEGDNKLNIILDFANEEIASKRIETIIIDKDTDTEKLENCEQSKTKLYCSYSYSGQIPGKILIKAEQKDPSPKAIHVLKYTQTHNYSPTEKNNNNIEISLSFQKVDDTVVEFSVFLQKENEIINDGVDVDLSTKQLTSISISIENFKIDEEYYFLIGSKKENNKHKEQFSQFLPVQNNLITGLLNTRFYKDESELKLIITFEIGVPNMKDIYTFRLIKTNQAQSTEEISLDCKTIDLLGLENNQIACSFSTVNKEEGEYKLNYYINNELLVTTDKSITVERKKTSINPLVYSLQGEVKITINYLEPIQDLNSESVTIVLVNDDGTNILTTTKDCQNNKECTLTINEHDKQKLTEGQYSIKTISKENEPIISEDKILVISPISELSGKTESILFKGLNKNECQIELTEPILKAQIEKIAIEINEKETEYYFEPNLLTLIKENETTHKSSKILIQFKNIYFTEEQYNLKLYIRTSNQEKPKIISVSLIIEDKYKIDSISKQIIQIGVDTSFDIIYNTPFEDDEKPIKIILQDEKEDALEFSPSFSEDKKTITIKLENNEINYKGIFKILTILNEENDYSVSSNDLVIVSYITPPEFIFNRKYLTKIKDEDDDGKNTKFGNTITIKQPENEVTPIIKIEESKDKKFGSTEEHDVKNNECLFTINLKEVSEHYFRYVIKDANNNEYKIPIDQKVIVSETPILSLPSNLSPCLYYQIDFSVKIQDTIMSEEDLKRIQIVMKNNKQELSFNLEKENNIFVYKGNNKDLIGNTYNFYIVENENLDHPIDTYSGITFTDLLYSDIAYKDSAIHFFNYQCTLTNLQLINLVTKATFNLSEVSKDNLKDFPEIKAGEYSLRIGDHEFDNTITIYNSIEATLFEINLPKEIKFGVQLPITIKCNQNGFTINNIEEIVLKKNQEKISIKQSSFEIKENILTFYIEMKEGDIYTINQIKRVKAYDEEEDFLIKNYNDNEYSIKSDSFKLLEEHYFGFRNNYVYILLEIFNQNNPDIKIKKNDQEISKCSSTECKIKVVEPSIYTVIDEKNKIEKLIYISVLDDESQFRCNTINPDSSSDQMLEITLTYPTSFLQFTPILKLNQNKFNAIKDSDTNTIHYKLKLIDLSDLKPSDNILSLQYMDYPTVNLNNDYSFYYPKVLVNFLGLFKAYGRKHNFIVSFESEMEMEPQFTLLAEPSDINVNLEKCFSFIKNVYECEFDLSNVDKGEYSLSYESDCEGKINLNKKIKVIPESELPFKFTQSIILLKDEGNKIEIKIENLEDNNNIILYYKNKNDANSQYEKMSFNREESKYYADIASSSAEYEFAYSYMINGYQFPLSKTIKFLSKGAKEITIDPEPSSCYYVKEPISFTIIPLDPEALSVSDLKVVLEGEGKEIEFEYKDNIFTLKDKEIDKGDYKIIISEIENSSEDVNLFSKMLSVSFTDIEVKDFYYKSSIDFKELKCSLDSYAIQKNDSTEKFELSCKEQEKQEGQNNIDLSCSLTDDIDSFGDYSFFVRDTLIKSSKIYNDISQSNFTFKKKAKLIEGKINFFNLSSSDFNLEQIKTIIIKEDDTPQIYTKGEENEQYIFEYKKERNEIEIHLNVTSIKKKYIITKIIREKLGEHENTEELTREIILDLSEVEECKDGLVINSYGLCDDPDNNNNNTEIKCSSYCKNYKSCKYIKSTPKCECLEGYYGLQCTLGKGDNITNEFENLTEKLFPDEDDDQTEIAEIEESTLFQSKALSILIVQSGETFKDQIISKRSRIYSRTKKLIANALSKKDASPSKGYLSLIDCSILIQITYLKMNKNRLRNLQTEIDELKELLQLSHEVYTRQDFTDDNGDYLSETDISETVLHQRWKNTNKGIEGYAKSSEKNNLAQINMISCDSSVNFQTNLLNSFSEEDQNTGIYITALDKEQFYDISQCKSVEISMKISNLPNSTVFNDCYKNNIDIYNPKDPLFQKACYVFDNFDYDIPQKYRRQQIYQNKILNVEGCTYDHIDYTNKIVYFTNCSLTSKSLGVECLPDGKSNCLVYEIPSNFTEEEYLLSKDDIDIEHVDNLPTKCSGDIDDIQSNIAFWIYLIIFALLLIFNIAFGVASKKMINEKAIVNDLHIFSKHFNHIASSEGNLKTEAELNKVVAPSEVKISFEPNRSFTDILISNFKSLHPLLSVCNSTIFSPIIFSSWVFVYNILNLFGFNALYFNETMIEDRIEDEHRDNFGYPMKTEFEKIMAAIATSIALNIVVRAIVIVTYTQKENLIASYKPGDTKAINDFFKPMLIRRLIAVIFMLALNIFFFYYCVVFCGIYVNTQYGWFYSGIWSLFWVWVIFAPIYILIISAVESKGSEVCAYYMKRLFVF